MFTRRQFVEYYYPYVKQLTAGTGIFPETSLSQAIVESQGLVGTVYMPGESELSKKYNNYFGIKADASWKGPAINLKTGEYTANGYGITSDYFRVYSNPLDSFKDHIKFLQENPRYRSAGVFTAATAYDQAKALQAAGYATNPNYSSLLSSVIASVKSYIPTSGAAGTGLAVLAAAAIIYFLL